jgi:hypothetical protein
MQSNSNVTNSNEPEYWIPTTPPTDDDEESEETEILQRGADAELKMMTETNYWVRLSLHTLVDEARRLQSELKLRAMSHEEREAYMRECESLAYSDHEEEDQEYQESYAQHLMNESLEQRRESLELREELRKEDEDYVPDFAANVPKTRTVTRETRETRETTRDKKPKQTQPGKKVKFVPIQITINVNHRNIGNIGSSSSSNSSSDDQEFAGKKEINLPPKQRTSREAKKRDDEKWTHINREQKHSNARGTH